LADFISPFGRYVDTGQTVLVDVVDLQRST